MKGLGWLTAVLVLAAVPALGGAATVEVNKTLLKQQKAFNQLAAYIQKLQTKTVGDTLKVKTATQIQLQLNKLASQAGLQTAPQLSLSGQNVLLEIVNVPGSGGPIVDPPSDPRVPEDPPVINPPKNPTGPTAVPAPVSLWAGLALLGGAGVTRIWRRSRVAVV